MIQALAIGLGIGFAAYSSLRLMVRRRYKPQHRKVCNGAETENPTLFLPIRLSPEAKSQVVDIEHDVSNNLLSQTAHSREDHSSNAATYLKVESASQSWFVIRTSRGLLKICHGKKKTKYTVDGPFDSKTAAMRAKLILQQS